MNKRIPLFLLVSLLTMLLLGCSAAQSGDSASDANASAQAPTEANAQAQTAPEGSDASADHADANNPMPESDADTLVIRERMFLSQVTDIYQNYEVYSDKTIVLEGMFAMFYDDDGAKTQPAVYRGAPGCCGNDGWAGFRLVDTDALTLPAENDWIRVTGTLTQREKNGYIGVYLVPSAIEVLDVRGAEFVS